MTLRQACAKAQKMFGQTGHVEIVNHPARVLPDRCRVGYLARTFIVVGAGPTFDVAFKNAEGSIVPIAPRFAAEAR